jgi:hypothetical protein
MISRNRATTGATSAAAYPNREHNAALRDLEDLHTLDALKRIVAHAIERAGQFDRIRHPDRRFSTEDLLEVLIEQQENITAEATRIRRSPVVV